MMLRMMVEDVCHCDALDITWARFCLILSRRKIFNKIKLGSGLDHKDLIDLQKQIDDGG